MLSPRRQTSFQTGKIGFGVQVVGIHKRRKQHTSEECGAETCGAVVAYLYGGHRKRGKRDFVFPYRVQLRNCSIETVGQGGRPVRIHAVCKACVMAGNAKGKQPSKLRSVPAYRDLRSSGGVIHSLCASRKPRLERLRVLANIVQ